MERGDHEQPTEIESKPSFRYKFFFVQHDYATEKKRAKLVRLVEEADIVALELIGHTPEIEENLQRVSNGELEPTISLVFPGDRPRSREYFTLLLEAIYNKKKIIILPDVAKSSTEEENFMAEWQLYSELFEEGFFAFSHGNIPRAFQRLKESLSSFTRALRIRDEHMGKEIRAKSKGVKKDKGVYRVLTIIGSEHTGIYEAYKTKEEGGSVSREFIGGIHLHSYFSEAARVLVKRGDVPDRLLGLVFLSELLKNGLPKLNDEQLEERAISKLLLNVSMEDIQRFSNLLTTGSTVGSAFESIGIKIPS
ncbi:hypothetical protein A3C77_00560 [Candidatus Giovannonibacteria bacterium RIFCSPHIGHO2_02_FULL_45_13]|nr:MAG: hypothetical protein A3C77_00560 [Candidatus Giovannonibacteria bacterium RIFCSPHIGHO2_02_FULL_45_13]